MNIRMILLGATALALPLAARAQPVSGLYVGVGAGVNFLMESNLEAKGPLAAVAAGGSTTRGTADFSQGWLGVLSLGYGFGNGLRVEIEGSYRTNEINGINGFSGIGRPRYNEGDARTYGGMVNAIYDIDLGRGSFVTPYVGIGAGYMVTAYDTVRLRSASGNSVTLDGDEGNFAYQAIVGGAFPISAVPGLSITAEYRFMQTLSSNIDAYARSAANGPVGARGTVEVDNMNHSLLMGIRYAFGAAPPPAPAIAAPAPVAQAPAAARTYLVFFDFDRADLTDRARQIIDEAAGNAKRAGVTRIELAGHADRSGSPQYNQALSLRRANAVAAELERKGVARAAMTIQAFGESRPLVATADGVREPQNRRVEIVLR